jgi:hypothetical protein
MTLHKEDLPGCEFGWVSVSMVLVRAKPDAQFHSGQDSISWYGIKQNNVIVIWRRINNQLRPYTGTAAP